MGRKVHPYGFRLGIIKPWRARWYAEGAEYGELLLEDIALRKMVTKEAAAAGIAEVTIERFPRQVNVTIHAAKPGIIIGRKGAAVNLLRDQVKEFTGKTAKVDVIEVRQPDANAMVIAQSVAGQLVRRISHKRAMKQAATKAMRAGAKGVKIVCSGRLGGSDMSRTDQVLVGRVPRQTLRADIDYARFEGITTFSVIGVKVWIYKGEVLPGDERLSGDTSDQSS